MKKFNFRLFLVYINKIQIIEKLFYLFRGVRKFSEFSTFDGFLVK